MPNCKHYFSTYTNLLRMSDFVWFGTVDDAVSCFSVSGIRVSTMSCKELDEAGADSSNPLIKELLITFWQKSNQIKNRYVNDCTVLGKLYFLAYILTMHFLISYTCFTYCMSINLVSLVEKQNKQALQSYNLLWCFGNYDNLYLSFFVLQEM